LDSHQLTTGPNNHFVQAGYVRVEWWTHDPWFRVHILSTNAPHPDIHGFVSLGFFPLRSLTIDCDNQKTTIT